MLLLFLGLPTKIGHADQACLSSLVIGSERWKEAGFAAKRNFKAGAGHIFQQPINSLFCKKLSPGDDFHIKKTRLDINCKPKQDLPEPATPALPGPGLAGPGFTGNKKAGLRRFYNFYVGQGAL